MKLSMLLFLCMVLSLCGGCNPELPSICDNREDSSKLCDIADKTGVRLETVGNTLIVVNSIAINKGKYTRVQAVVVLAEIRSLLGDPISYLIMREELENIVSLHPGLILIASGYLRNFNTNDIVSDFDRNILLKWLDNRIEELEE